MKLNPEFRRDAYHNYMVFSQGDKKDEESCTDEYKNTYNDSYELQMVRQNKLSGLLDLKVTVINGKVMYTYEITGRQTLLNMLEIRKINQEGCLLLFRSLFKTINTCEEYLLDYQHIVIQPEYIYYNWDTKSYEFLYHVEYHENLMKQINSLAEYLMDMVDYADEKGVFTVYGIFHKSKKNESTLSELMKFIETKEIEETKEVEKSESVEKTEQIEKTEKPEKTNKTEKTDKTREIDKYNETKENVTRVQLVQRPKVEVRQESEEVVYQYPKTSYIIISVVVLVMIILAGVSIVYDMEMQKSGAILLVGLSVSLYVASKVFDKDKKIEKIVPRVDYIMTEEEYTEDTFATIQSFTEPRQQQINQNVQSEELTQLLSIVVDNTETKEQKAKYILLPELEEIYEVIYLEEFPCLIGKIKEGIGAIINEASISRIHAKITCEDDAFYLTDLGSLNGSFVNDTMIQPYGKSLIKEGDQLRFANVAYCFQKYRS